MDEILSIILKDTYSITQFKHRVRLLKSNLLKTFFGSSENLSPVTQDSNWLKSLPTSFYQKFNKDNVYSILADLEKTTNSLPILTIYLAFEPDDVSLNQLGILARQNFGLSSLLLDIRLDHSLIAGAALSWKGVYRDYSLRAKIEERKDEISEGFKKFLR